MSMLFAKTKQQKRLQAQSNHRIIKRPCRSERSRMRIFLSQALYVLSLAIVDSDRRKYLLVSGFSVSVVMGLFLLPLSLSLIANAGRKSFWIQKPEPDFFVAYFKSYFGSTSLAIICAVVLFWSLFELFGDTNKKIKSNLIALFVIGILIYFTTYLTSILSTPILTGRNTIAVIIPVLLLISLVVLLTKCIYDLF